MCGFRYEFADAQPEVPPGFEFDFAVELTPSTFDNLVQLIERLADEVYYPDGYFVPFVRVLATKGGGGDYNAQLMVMNTHSLTHTQSTQRLVRFRR